MKNRSNELELMDDLNLATDELRQNLEELETVNRWLGGYSPVINALNKNWNTAKKISIADIGSGGGDTLRIISEWAKRKKLDWEGVGIDANQFMIDFSRQKAKDFPEISFEKVDIFDTSFQEKKFDFVVCSLFCHHFSEEDLVKMFAQLNQQANICLIINDLHRNWLAYYGIYILTRLFNGSRLVKNDAPLSVKRAFSYQNLKNIAQKANLSNYTIRWRWAFRWQMIIKK